MMHIFISAAGDDIRPGATGKAVPGYRACVLDKDGTPLPHGTGRLAVKGPTGCRYFDDERQADYVQNGWNITGDTYRQDEDGTFWYVARSDDMIISSGYNIAAPEVENALLTHDAVQECAVIGVPCEERGPARKGVRGARAGARARRGARRPPQDAREGDHRALQISPRGRVRVRTSQDRNRQAQTLRAAGW
jgi:2-aminobenzoate-CoA ligase